MMRMMLRVIRKGMQCGYMGRLIRLRKTHLAAAIAMRLYIEGSHIIYTVPDLLDSLVHSET